MSDSEEGEIDFVSVPCEVTGVSDGEFIIFDWAEFAETFSCYGVMLVGRDVFLLDRHTRDWKDLKLYKTKPMASVRKLREKQGEP